MNAVEKIQAAIEWLEVIKAAPSPVYLTNYDYEMVQDGNDDDLVSYAFDAGVAYGSHGAVHRTIDAQLAILRSALTYTVGDLTFTLTNPQQYSPEAVALAEAILA